MAQSSMEPVTASYYVRECSAILVGALGTVLLLALISYVPVEASSGQVTSHFNNLIGTIGNATAFGLFWAFGIIAFLLPCGLLCACAMMLLWRNERLDWSRVALCLGGGLLFTFSGTVLATLHWSFVVALPFGAGGAMGSVFVALTMELVNTPGLTILTFAVILISLQLIFGFRWLSVLEWIGHTLVTFWMFMRRAIARVAKWSMLRAKSMWVYLRKASQAKAMNRYAAPLAKKERIPPAISFTDELPKLQSSSETPVVATIAKPAQVPARANVERSLLGGLPSLEILSTATGSTTNHEEEHRLLIELGERLRVILADYGVAIEVESIISGPVVSRFEIQLAPGLKVSKIVSLANDLAREIAVRSVRVVPVIPGKSVVGIEIPNHIRATVTLREVLVADEFNKAKRPLTLALGKDIAGEPVFADLERMPHLLVAGTTGSGKSVGVNAMLLSLLYRLTPEELRLILIDPKMLELSVYEDIPHLLAPVVTDMQDAAKALQWCVQEMERRYRLMMELKVRNLGGYNEKIAAAERTGELILDPLWDPDSEADQQTLAKLPLIVVVVDEFADMMMIVGKKLEQLIARIAQKARAAGIHLVLATQRPSAEVITGLIKANIPCRISYQVSSHTDSRVILDQNGAEHLLGHGDMLFLAPGASLAERVHGAYVSDEEVLAVVADLRQRGEPDYVYEVVSSDSEFDVGDLGLNGIADDGDDLFQQAVRFVIESRRASASALQTKFQIGWNKAARYMDQMEKEGIVTEPDQKGRREVIVAEE